MPVSIALKLGLAAAVGAAAAALSHNIQPALPPPFEMVSLVMSNGRQLDAGRDEITWALWKQCHDTGACENLPPAPPNDGRNYPATRINGQDVEQFLSWINAKTGDEWRLPTLTEWREMSQTLPKPESKKRFTDPRLSWAADYGTVKPQPRKLQPSGSFGALANGLRDVGGNVWEWTASCVNPDPGAYMCPAYFVGGEHEAEIPIFLRDPITGGCATGSPPANLGFRLVRDS